MAEVNKNLLNAILEADDNKMPGGGGIMGVYNPTFDPVKYAGALPSLNLSFDPNTSTLDFDANAYLQLDASMPQNEKDLINDEVNSLIDNAIAGDKEAGVKALASSALDQNDIPLPEKQELYANFNDLVAEGGLNAVYEMVKELYGANEDEERVPEYALPSTVFGVFLQNEPGDVKQAILRAKGKTAVTLNNIKQKEAEYKRLIDKEIRLKAIDLYTDSMPTATDYLELVGKVTPESLDKYAQSRKFSDLVPIKTSLSTENLIKDFTVDSIAAWQKSGDVSKLVRNPVSGTGLKQELIKNYTPESINAYEEGGSIDESLLVLRQDTGSNAKDYFDLLDKYTPQSVDQYVSSGRFSDLKPNDNVSYFFDEDLSDEQKITAMVSSKSIDSISKMPVTQKLDTLSQYRSLYITTLRRQIDKPGETGVTVKETLPFGEITPLQFASKIGLDVNDDDVIRRSDVAMASKPKANREDLGRLNAMYDLRKRWNIVGDIVNLAPENITGITGEFFKSNAARILVDVLPFDIPADAKVVDVFNSVAELQLITDLLNEKRFTDADRRLVREFIGGKPFKDKTELLLRYNEISNVINRAIGLDEFGLLGFELPEGMDLQKDPKLEGTEFLTKRKSELIKKLQGDE